MKLFDLTPQEARRVRVFLLWHFAYAFYVAVFAFVIYKFHWFKAYWFLKEFWILNLIAPVHTIIFIIISPYRRDWIEAIRNMYRTLDGDLIFCLMAFLVFGFGFYLYNAIIWAVGSLLPSIFFT